jgi:mono/diheme cytochrome c family protein
VNRLLIGILSLWIVISSTEANADGVAAGRELALEVCSVCHDVGAHQQFAPRLGQPTPSFVEIANNPKTTAESLRKFITTTHWDERTIPITMPDPMLAGDQIPDVISYILSLRK